MQKGAAAVQNGCIMLAQTGFDLILEVDGSLSSAEQEFAGSALLLRLSVRVC